MIQFNCPKCGHPYKLRDELAGRTARCAKCRETMKVPSPEVPVAAGDQEHLDSMLSLLGQAEQSSQATEPVRRIPRTPAPAPMPTSAPAPQTRTAPRRQPSYSSDIGLGMLGSIIGAALGAGVGAAIWIGIGYATGYEIGWIAVLVGVLAGLGAVGLGREQSPTVGVIAAIAGLAGILVGSYGTYYVTIHAEKTMRQLLPAAQTKLQEDPEFKKLPDDEQKRIARKFVEEQVLPRVTYSEVLCDSPKGAALLVLFGLFGLGYGYKYGSGGNQTS